MFRRVPGSPLLLATALLALATDASARPLAAACADGSVVLAKKWQDVGCVGALRMPSGQVPPVRWAGYRLAVAGRRQEAAREQDLEQQIAAAASRRRDTARFRSVLLVLGERSRGDLRRLVALGRAPAAASIEYPHRAGDPDRMRLAHSRWLEARLRDAFTGLGMTLPGPVLVFSLEPSFGAPSAPLPSFAQGGVTFRPESGDARQLGWISGGASDWPGLGYVVLPSGFDVKRPLAIFWGDAVVATRPWTGGM